MKSQKLQPNDVTFNTLIDCCVRANKMPKAWTLLKEMQESDITPDNFTYSTIIKGIKPETQHNSDKPANYCELNKAFILIDQLKKRGNFMPDEVLFNCLIDACVRFRDIPRALTVF